MPMLKLEVSNVDQLLTKYGEQSFAKAKTRALEKTLTYTTGLVKRRVAGKHHVTGFLLSSITNVMETDNQGRVFAQQAGNVYYAKWVEQGTGIHGPQGKPITPKKAKLMAWYPTSVTGKPLRDKGKIYRKKVAGQKPVKMFYNTYKQDADKIKQYYKESFAAELP